MIARQGGPLRLPGCAGYDLDAWRQAIWDSTCPPLTVDIEELDVPEGRLLLVRVPKGAKPPYGTPRDVLNVRVGKNCIPLDPVAFKR